MDSCRTLQWFLDGVNIYLVKFIISDLFAEDLFEVTSCYFPIDFTPVSGLRPVVLRYHQRMCWLQVFLICVFSDHHVFFFCVFSDKFVSSHTNLSLRESLLLISLLDYSFHHLTFILKLTCNKFIITTLLFINL